MTAVATFGILGLQNYGARPLEAVITIMVAAIAECYLLETIFESPDWAEVGTAFAPPRFDGRESVVLAVGILGATVMPHVIFLHSALTQNRIVARDARAQRRLFRFQLIDVVVAMTLAGAINAAMLIMAAATFNHAGLIEIASIEEAHRTLTPLLGSAASVFFGISLLVSGLSSSTVGTMAGQLVIQGFLRRSIPLWMRRAITMIPTLIIIGIGADPTDTLVMSQVVLSFGIPFALIPLVMFTSRKQIMGETLVNRRMTTMIAIGIVALIVALNGYLLFDLTFG